MRNFTSDNLNDLFEWGNDRFVLGKLADKSGTAGKKKKSNYEIFMEAFMDDEEEKKPDDDTKEEIPVPEIQENENNLGSEEPVMICGEGEDFPFEGEQCVRKERYLEVMGAEKLQA
mmetsp:Transcript_29230/g.21762  ORF Transcript_29230/g.21762 Transcript_29230/m.21762 type:complete len:116 (+) Transcript_29230:763-1110(+)|eukprot:CAMPEP_0202971754 /NCGR_PEP_ID=MMETSP1396-20130829/30477_1 /ASSEMBLY_ACC=CAM_ASM_000872 /TAXON_ID= /ORGANISM="Pseudokeronopsis sp., Strain Brazil" /LENGTH=115 /DNA_ID=CAMNT_0049701471 /DNA_START=757 /DNA_END=1104 /DNA_ORIENTATION=+